MQQSIVQDIFGKNPDGAAGTVGMILNSILDSFTSSDYSAAQQVIDQTITQYIQGETDGTNV